MRRTKMNKFDSMETDVLEDTEEVDFKYRMVCIRMYFGPGLRHLSPLARRLQ